MEMREIYGNLSNLGRKPIFFRMQPILMPCLVHSTTAGNTMLRNKIGGWLYILNDPPLCKEPEELIQILQLWHSPFSAVSVISNRSTPLLWDTGGRAQWFDFLIALGDYQHGRFGIPGLGVFLKYNPGTDLAFSG